MVRSWRNRFGKELFSSSPQQLYLTHPALKPELSYTNATALAHRRPCCKIHVILSKPGQVGFLHIHILELCTPVGAS